MVEERNQHQIIRKDARNCFVESLSDKFPVGKVHLVFVGYDPNKPSGQRQNNSVHIFMGASELLELCRKLSSGEMRYRIQEKRQSGDTKPLQQWLGGTSAEKLMKYGKPRPDGKSLSRTAALYVGNKTDFLFVADSGPGESDKKGLIVPRFGKNPENHVAVSMSWETLSELLLTTKIHYEAWLSAWYAHRLREEPGCKPVMAQQPQFPQNSQAAYQSGEWF